MVRSDELRVGRAASTAQDPVAAVREIRAGLAADPSDLVILFVSSDRDLDALGRAIEAELPGREVIGCTTAGEIGPAGYRTGSISAASVGGPGFVARAGRIDGIQRFELGQARSLVRSMLADLAGVGVHPTARDAFGFLLCDGLAMQEEAIVASLARELGDVPLIGGSAGDGTRFGRTHVYHQGRFRTDAAVFTLVRTSNPFVVMKTEHFVAASDKLVVTGADPARRLVTEIDGEPAARRYAKILGLAPDKLSPFVFARHPVVVRVGGALWVRSIQKVNDDESLTFFCAIDEGIVLTVARGIDLVEDLSRAFATVRERLGEPRLVLGCDCILRFLEIEERGANADVARIFEANRVVGFATYGEQLGAMHVNQTFTGVAIGARHDG